MSNSQGHANLGGFAFETLSPGLRELRSELIGQGAPLHMQAALDWIAGELPCEAVKFSESDLLGLELDALMQLRAGAQDELPGCEQLLVELLIGAACLVAHGRLLWRGELPELVADLSELIDLLPRCWGELCARAVPLAEDLMQLGSESGAQFLLDGYEVFEPIGHGGMGQIRRAREHATGRWVAIKFLSSVFQSEEMLSRFDREGRLLDSLDHVGVAKFYGQGLLNSMGSQVPYLVMELLKGEGPRAYAERCALSERERLLLFIKICDAIEHAHSKGVIHRDLHPGNILVTEAGQPKVLDFGIARCTRDQEQGLTRTGQVFGVAAYLSPEQASGELKEGDVRMDVYALGAILFELLSGQTPHALGGMKLQQAWRSVATQHARHLRQVMPRADKRLEGILARALEFEAPERYATVHALAGDLRAYLKNEKLNAPELTLGYMASVLLRRHRGKVLLGGLALALLLSSSLWALWSRDKAITAVQLQQRGRTELAELARLSIDALIETWEHEGPQSYVEDAINALRAQVHVMENDKGPEFAGLLADLGKLEGEWAYANRDFATAMRFFEQAEGVLARQLDTNELCPLYAAKRSILLVRIGDTAKVQGQRGRAAEIYQRALEIDRHLALESGQPRDALLQDNYCWSLIRRIEQHLDNGDFELAKSCLGEALGEVDLLLSLAPERAHSHHAKGRVLVRSFQVQEALGQPYEVLLALLEEGAQSAQRAAELDPGRDEFEFVLQGALKQLGTLLLEHEPERARDILEQATHLHNIRIDVRKLGG